MNILLADDHVLFRECLFVALHDIFPGSSITSAGDWSDVYDHVKGENYDLLLLDLFMPSSELTSWKSHLSDVIASKGKAVVCIVSASNNRAYVRQAFDIGVQGYVFKTYSLQQMKQSLIRVCSGKICLPSELWGLEGPKASKKPGQVQIKKVAQLGGYILTRRQQEILELMCGGNSNKAIGGQLNITENTVKCHVYKIYRTLSAKNRVDAVMIARQKGLVAE